MSLGAAVRATVRPWKAAVKPSKFVAEQPMNFKKLPNATTLTVVEPAAVAPSHDGTCYVTTPGKPLIIGGIIQHHVPVAEAPKIVWSEIAIAFKTWHRFYIFPPGFLAQAKEVVKAAVGDKLPGGGH